MYINVIIIIVYRNKTLIVEGDLEQIIPTSSQFQAILDNGLL